MDYRELFKPAALSFLIGVVVGAIFSFIHFKLVEISIKNAINNQKAGILSIILYVLKPVLLAVPLALSVLIPKYVNIFGCFTGVIVPKLYLFGKSILNLKNHRR